MGDSIRVRDGGADDLPMLEAMLFEAFFWRPERERPALDDHRSDVEFQKWVRGFGGRAGDRAVIAERIDDDGATPVGAASHRLFTDAEHSYGYIDAATPEIVIGVARHARGEGVGRALMQALIERARGDGRDALSLSVEPDNFARRLYEQLGFERVNTVGGAWTMKLSLYSLFAIVFAALASRAALLATVAVVALASTGCGGPFFIIPGGELRGEVATEPVTDWSFVDDAFIDLEVRPSDPYSVELNYTVKDGALYIDPADGRKWFDYLREEPNVRVRLGGKVYPVTAVLVAEPGKHGELEGFDPDRFVYRLDSRPAGSP